MKTAYLNKSFADKSLDIINVANGIIVEYQAQRLDLTLRQLYYQMVARDYLPNSQASYNRLGSIVNNARLAGLIDWDSIVDRTRNLYGLTHQTDVGTYLDSLASEYFIDLWEGQKHYVEVWVEKDALADVIGRAATPLDVNYFPCRGYVSQSAQWRAAMRLVGRARDGQRPVIIHLGDHDPSGIDMSRDIFDRLELFMEHHGVEAAKVNRIALNMDQVRQYNPPPNPAKVTDSRAGDYIDKYGKKSWELDALDPSVLMDLVRKEITKHITSQRLFDERSAALEDDREYLRKIARNQDAVRSFLDELDD